MWLEKAVTSVKEAFQSPSFPEAPQGHLTKGERREYERQLKDARKKQQTIYLQRRRLLVYGGMAGAAALGLAIFGPDFARSQLPIPSSYT